MLIANPGVRVAAFQSEITLDELQMVRSAPTVVANGQNMVMNENLCSGCCIEELSVSQGR